MAFNFNDEGGGGPLQPPDPLSPDATATDQPVADASPVEAVAHAEAASSGGPGGTTSAPAAAPEQSAAFVRFGTCRWQEPADKDTGAVAFCTHREVKPYAGAQSFDPDAWCLDCQYYKLRRVPKKRERTEDYFY